MPINSDVIVSYKGLRVVGMRDSGYAQLTTAGKYMEDNIQVTYFSPADGDLLPMLPDYKQAQYLDFDTVQEGRTSSMGIVVHIPSAANVIYTADCKCKKLSHIDSCVFGYISRPNNFKDFCLGIQPGSTSDRVISSVRGTRSYGYGFFNGSNRYSSTYTGHHILQILLKNSRKKALVGRYSYEDADYNNHGWIGPFYSLTGMNVETEKTIAYFVPAYRVADNKIGVYDYVSRNFYCHTYTDGIAVTTISKGPDATAQYATMIPIEPAHRWVNNGHLDYSNNDGYFWVHDDSATNCLSDVYQVGAGIWYNFKLGDTASTKFRVVFSPYDVSDATENVYNCTEIYYPESHSPTDLEGDPQAYDACSFKAPERGYVIIQTTDDGTQVATAGAIIIRGLSI